MIENRSAPELPYLEAFYAVCTEGGFTAAARRLGCTQPAVSYQIRTLEEEIGVPLLERSGRRVLPTPAGQRYRAFCERFFGELARVRSACASGRRPEPLRLGSASGFGRYVLVPSLHRLRSISASQDLQVALEFDAADTVLDDLERGVYEAVFVYQRRISNVLRFLEVYSEELVLIGAPSLLEALDRTALDDPGGYPALPFVTYEEGDYVFGRWFEAVFGEQPDSVRSVSYFTELEEVIDFVRTGAGLSVLPRDAAEAACERGAVEVVHPCGRPRCFNPVYMVVRASSVVRPELERLAEIIRSREAEERGRGRGGG